MMIRRLFLFPLCLASLGVCTPAIAAEQPNILLITIDDLNDWVGCLDGHPQASTPHLDRLAARGVLFTNAHCQTPICKPSRASFLSGLRPSTTGAYSNIPANDAKGRLTPGKDVPWLPIRFQQAGYRTYAAGKVLHHGNRGLGEILAPPSGQGPYPEKKMNVPSEVTPKGVWDYGPFPDEENFTDWKMAKWTIDHIAEPLAENDNPRFLSLGFHRPHVPLFAPKKWFDAAPKLEDIILAPSPPDDIDDLPAIARRMHSRVLFQSTVEWVKAEESRMRELTQAYLATTSAMDDCLGQVIDALDNSDMADGTWIVVFSDHGWHLGEKNHVAKQTLWERSTRVPLVIVPPKRITDTPRGVRCERPVDLIDIYPTLLAAAAIPAADSDKHLEGLSLMPWIANPAAPRERPALTTLYSHNHTLRDERYRYIRYADGSEELYDHSTDPHEHHNLIAKTKENPELRAAVERLSAWLPKEQAGQPDLVLPVKRQ